MEESMIGLLSVGMGKVQYRHLDREERTALEAGLHAFLNRLPHRRDVVDFLFDFLTTSEWIMLSRRLRIARRLLAGKSHLEISQELHAGLATIQMVDRWLRKKFENYRRDIPPLLEKISREMEKKTQKKHPIPLDPLSLRSVRKRYPMHSLLFNLLLGDPQEYEVEGGAEW